MGLAFWSMLDAAGQYAAVVFDSEYDARDYVSRWETKTDPDDFVYVELDSKSGEYATVPELIAVGLDHMTSLMLFSMPVQGHS